MTISYILSLIDILVSIVMAWLIYRLQKSADNERMITQQNIERTNQIINLFMDAELSLYQTARQIVTDCYLSASTLHPTYALVGGPHSYNERDEWHRARCNDLLEKIRSIRLLKEANSMIFSKNILESLEKFIEICNEQVSDYSTVYIPAPHNDDRIEWRNRAPIQERCYKRNEDISAAYNEFQKCVNDRINYLKNIK